MISEEWAPIEKLDLKEEKANIEKPRKKTFVDFAGFAAKKPKCLSSLMAEGQFIVKIV